MKDKKRFGMLSLWRHPEVLYEAFAPSFKTAPKASNLSFNNESAMRCLYPFIISEFKSAAKIHKILKIRNLFKEIGDL